MDPAPTTDFLGRLRGTSEAVGVGAVSPSVVVMGGGTLISAASGGDSSGGGLFTFLVTIFSGLGDETSASGDVGPGPTGESRLALLMVTPGRSSGRGGGSTETLRRTWEGGGGTLSSSIIDFTTGRALSSCTGFSVFDPGLLPVLLLLLLSSSDGLSVLEPGRDEAGDGELGVADPSELDRLRGLEEEAEDGMEKLVGERGGRDDESDDIFRVEEGDDAGIGRAAVVVVAEEAEVSEVLFFEPGRDEAGEGEP